MKKWLIWMAFLWALPAMGALGPQTAAGKQEAVLFNRFLRAVYALRDGDPKTYTYLQQALQQDPTSKYIKRLLVATAVADEKPALAAPYADYITQEGQNDAEDWSVYAAYQWKKGNAAEARRGYEEALKLTPEDTRVLYQYVLLLSVIDYQKALEVLEKTAQERPSLAGLSYTSMGQLYARRGSLEQALTYYTKAVEADPSDPTPRIGRAEIYEKKKQYFLLLHELEELENMGYANAETYTRMGAIFLLVNDITKGEAYLLKAKEKAPNDIAIAQFLSGVAEYHRDYTHAITYLQDSADYQTNPARWLQVAFYQQKMGNLQASIQTMRQAYRKFPQQLEIAYFYALALNDANQFDPARRVLENVLKARPEYHDARVQYAYALDGLKKYKAMEQEVERVLKAQPKHAAALNLYAYSLAQRGERLDEAAEYIARALALMPQEIAFIDTQAWVYFKQGRVQDAANLLDGLPKEDVLQNPEIAYHKATILAALGRREEAVYYLTVAADGGWPAAVELSKQIQ